ncbi:MAG: trigger factor family protein, partial [Planctomycetes bacterium]|nr:trigger factor family protein [Planctomycetota bacterium]
MTENEKVGGGQAGSEDATAAVASSEEKQQRLDQDVQIESVGPCRKHVRVRVPRKDIDRFHEEVTRKLVETAEVPGFRKGRVPAKLVAKRFRREIADEVRQKVLLQSLEQLTEDHDLDPINEPDLDVEALEIPEEGDFEYEFDVEV